jgi:hypothetical protein
MWNPKKQSPSGEAGLAASDDPNKGDAHELCQLVRRGFCGGVLDHVLCSAKANHGDH